MKVTSRSKVMPVELTVRPDRQGYIVEDATAGEFYEMSEPSVQALQRMREGLSLEAIEEELSARFPDEEIDMIGFAEQLLELKLVAELDGIPVRGESDSERSANAKPLKSGGFGWISEPFARFWFHPVMRLLYVSVIIMNIALFIAKPGLFPQYRDVFLFESMALNSLIWLGISFVLLMLHELGHIMAVRSFGLPAKLGIGHRFLFVVFETEMDGVWRLTPKQRNRAYLAGAGMDQVMLLLCLAVQFALPGEPGFVAKLAAFAALDLVVKLVFQCCFYMKTDLYYVVENGTGCYNLMERSREWLAVKLRGRGGDPARAIEERAVKWYAVFYAAGYVFTLGMIALFFAPQLIVSLTTVIPRLAFPAEGGPFWDAVVFLAECIGLGALLLYSWIKSRRNAV
ncbi:peptidase [Paenibacillus hemerocallicola]|uniref:Peptidase n=1 Tax=Paenibacillus hemerocallicola TaxID=1172614 RepID=A0A5C4TEW3_9BACL|nr:peptidase [Paenibacillus hemerocallicola]TNJ67087.1 peptidase [Paenibacillus hemerocallicola]